MNLIERAADRLARDAASPRPDATEPPPAEARESRDVRTPPVADAARPAVEPSAAGPAAAGRQSPATRRSRDGVIDVERLRASGMFPPPGAEVVISEFRKIARRLLDNAIADREEDADRGNVILLTSALRGEGKTFCAINIALGIALESERHVLLVDADVAKPAIAESMGLEADLGLVDRLLDETVDLADALIRTDVPNLAVLAAGSKTKHGADLLSGDRMAWLIGDLAERYADRLIVIDAPNVIDNEELPVLAREAGQVVVVVEADRTPQQVLKQALADLAGCANVELLLNKRSASFRTGGGLEPEVSREE